MGHTARMPEDRKARTVISHHTLMGWRTPHILIGNIGGGRTHHLLRHTPWHMPESMGVAFGGIVRACNPEVEPRKLHSLARDVQPHAGDLLGPHAGPSPSALRRKYRLISRLPRAPTLASPTTDGH